MHRYDEASLIAQLEVLPGPARAGFAAGLAEHVARKASDSHFYAALSRGLEALWGSLLVPKADMRGHLEACTALMPDEDDCASVDAHLAADALAIAVYALRARVSAVAQEAAWAARRHYELFDYQTIATGDVVPGTLDRESEILAQPSIQSALAFQADLLRLAQVDLASGTFPSRVRDFAVRAAVDARTGR